MEFQLQGIRNKAELTPSEILALRAILADPRSSKHAVTIPFDITFALTKDNVNHLLTTGSIQLKSDPFDLTVSVVGTDGSQSLKIMDPPTFFSQEVIHPKTVEVTFTNGNASLTKKISSSTKETTCEHVTDGWVITPKYPLSAYCDDDKDSATIHVTGYIITARN